MDLRSDLTPEPPPAVLEAVEHISHSRSRVARRSRVREVVFGTQDGLLTTLGLLSGVGGATSDRYTIIVAGLAGSLAGMIAMGAGAYIASKSQAEVHLAEVERERYELLHNPARELEELVHLFQAEGLPEEDARLVAGKIAERPAAMLRAMTQMELGLQVGPGEPIREGAVMAVAFAVGALVPLAPWFLAPTTPVQHLLWLHTSAAGSLSVVLTIATLFILGAGKSVVARTSAVRGGAEIVAIGLLATVGGAIIGSLLPRLVGAH